MKKKDYYTEEMEKSLSEKIQTLSRQKYYTAGSIVLMAIVLVVMYFILY